LPKNGINTIENSIFICRTDSSHSSLIIASSSSESYDESETSLEVFEEVSEMSPSYREDVRSWDCDHDVRKLAAWAAMEDEPDAPAAVDMARKGVGEAGNIWVEGFRRQNRRRVGL
jgi:hypothetical protein